MFEIDPSKHQHLVGVGVWAASLGALGALARILAQKLTFKVALGTLLLGVVGGILTGVIVQDIDLPDWMRNAAVALSGICGKELTEFIIRTVSKLRDKSNKVADKLIDKI